LIAIKRHVDGIPLLESGLAVLAAATIVFAYASPLAGMVDLWIVSPVYSYAFTVPLVSAYLVWARWDALRVLRPRPSRLVGGAVLLAAVAALVIARAASIQVVQQLAFLLALVGAVLLLLGSAYLRVAGAALAYLLLMIPVWDTLTESLHYPFQLQSAAMSVGILQMLGIPAYLEGTYIALPGITLEVARACSGVNYLIAILALGLPLSYLCLSTMWRRVLLIVAAMTIAALSNGVRVALIGILSHYDLGSPLHGPFHVLHGLSIAAGGYAILFLGLRLLRDGSQAVEVPHQEPVIPAEPWRLPRPELIAVTLGFLALGSAVLAYEPQVVPLSSALDTLPASLGRWEWDRTAPEAALGDDLWPGADAVLNRRYRTGEGTEVDLHIAYFGAQRQDREIANFRVADWHRRAALVSLTGSTGQSFEANFVRGDGGQPHALFWYEVDAATETSQYGAKLRTVWSALRRAQTNAAVVMLVLPAPLDGDQASTHLRDLGSEVYRAFDGLLTRRETQQ
jgi:EpsI family protein